MLNEETALPPILDINRKHHQVHSTKVRLCYKFEE